MSDIKVSCKFLMKIFLANRNTPDGSEVLRRHIWGYTVCLYPIKRTSGLNELN